MDPDIPVDIDPAGELLAQQNRNDNDEINAALLGENDPLGKSPPDFTIAWKHSDAHKVKNSRLIGDSSKAAKDEKNFCPWCRFPTSKIVPKYSLCTNAKNLSNLGLGFPLYSFNKNIIELFV